MQCKLIAEFNMMIVKRFEVFGSIINCILISSASHGYY